MKKYWCYFVFPLCIILFTTLNFLLLSDPVIDGTYKGQIEGSTVEIKISNDFYYIYTISDTSSVVIDSGIYTPDGIFISQKNNTENKLIKSDNTFRLRYDEHYLYNTKVIVLQVVYGIMILVGITGLTVALIKPYLSDSWVQNKIHQDMTESLNKIHFNKKDGK